MILHNVTRQTVLAKEPRRARTIFSRMRGMIGRKFSDSCDALIFERCNAIHSLFMSQKIDVLFISSENRILHTRAFFPPWRLYEGCRSAILVIELPEGTVSRTGTQEGDYIDLDVEQISDLNTSLTGITHTIPATNLYRNEK